MAHYKTIEQMIAEAAEGVRPAERTTVSQTAAKIRKLVNPGAYTGDWLNETVPYLQEPMDILTSLDYRAMVFAGPAQTGKTDMFLNWLTHTIVKDPADMMLIQTGQNTARDFARRRVDRLHRHTPETGARLIKRRDADSIFTKQYTSGMMLTLSWPTINELSGRPVGRLWLTDYDRMTQNVDGEGSPFFLSRKRATTFGRHGMTAVESSPGFMVSEPKWSRPVAFPHMAPPCQGVLSLYNQGDRRLFYWRCPQCKHVFEPDFKHLKYPKTLDFEDAGEQAVMMCPHCTFPIPHNTDQVHGLPGKYEMNLAGKWVPEGMVWEQDGTLSGKKIRTDIASFWMKGVCAAFVDWKTLVVNYEKALQEYENTGSEEALKVTVNTDQGLPYTPKRLSEGRNVEMLKELADKTLVIGVVPFGVRFLVAVVDVQKSRFEVMILGFGYGGDIWVVEKFQIRKSKRKDEDGDRWPVSPHAYLEDWRLLYHEVMERTYPLADNSGRRMRIKMSGCDSGGKEGVTAKAYEFYRELRNNDDDPETEEPRYKQGSHLRFRLFKGRKNEHAPRVQQVFPDSERKDRHADAKGEIPVLMINTDMIKDETDAMFDRKDPCGGRLYIPADMPDAFYNELIAETKTHKGWENLKKLPNEGFDLLGYARALAIYAPISIEHLDWDNPPNWAAEWDDNSLVFDPENAQNIAGKPAQRYDLAQLAETLA